jgi:hypothetical protein
MKRQILRTLSIVTIVVLAVTAVVVALPALPASAHHAHPGILRTEMTQTAQVTISNPMIPGLIAAMFLGDPSISTIGTPGGVFEGAVIFPADGKPLLVQVPVGKTTSFYGWDDEGYWLFGSVSPVNSAETPTIDAKAVIAADPDKS